MVIFLKTKSLFRKKSCGQKIQGGHHPRLYKSNIGSREGGLPVSQREGAP